MPWKYASSGLILAAAVLAGCSSTSGTSKPAEESASDAGYSRCDAAAAQFAIGKPASPALLEQARIKAGAQTARVLGPDDMVTFEYRSDRLNLNTDQTATVNRVNCG
ncbi:I78 family peptidase inhibitor [Pseudomonas sp. LP_7_YM]|uniref:I78 family peptidase inhibitor n=1 Tax=Pseudomonas sp. LP_7_YM TaxID=2485137 RepID=UPI00105D512E|nr:I78 family peptidase inhibitor [Pseudomonas sp. LP_7_YM]TDV67692.1 peptidase inhibitor I78 family protein [Pseudomonas sp. LP_7_YM]